MRVGHGLYKIKSRAEYSMHMLGAVA